MKKIVAFLFAALMLGSTMSLVGCQKGDVIDIYLPDGAPALALVSVFDREEIAGQKVKFTVVPAENISTYLLSGTPELAIVPTNVASIVFNRGKDYKFVSANTHGNLFLVGKGDVSELSGLKGKTVKIIGQGKVPDLMMQALLKRNGIEYTTDGSEAEDKVNLSYVSDGSQIMLGLKNGNFEYGLLAEPAATTARGFDGVNELFDIQELWGTDGYPQAGLVAKNSISDKFISELFKAVEDAGNYAEQNPDEALERIKSHMLESTQTTLAKLTAEMIHGCNIRLVKAQDCKAAVTELLSAFMELNPSTVGGSVPGDEFFRIIQ